MLNDETAKIADFGFCMDYDAPPFKVIFINIFLDFFFF